MNFKKRLGLAISICVLLTFWHYLCCFVNDVLIHHLKYPTWNWHHRLPRGGINITVSYSALHFDTSKLTNSQSSRLTSFQEHEYDIDDDEGEFWDSKNCRMETCFNLEKCRDKPFKVYVYTEEDVFGGGQPFPSENYAKVENCQFNPFFLGR